MPKEKKLQKEKSCAAFDCGCEGGTTRNLFLFLGKLPSKRSENKKSKKKNEKKFLLENPQAQ
jgi:hypothetical protein